MSDTTTRPDALVSTAAAPPPTAGTARRRLSFRARTLVAYVGIAVGLTALLLVGLLLNAKVAVEDEVTSSFAVASRYLQSRKVEIQKAAFPESYLASLGLDAGAIRHVRAIVLDDHGRVLPPRSAPDGVGDDDDVEPPDWFVALLSVDRLREEIPLVFRTGRTATIILESEPHDEIAEVWQDLRFILPVMVGQSLLLLGASVLVLNHLFRRIHVITAGLDRLREGHLDVRVADLRIPELATIVDRFNDLAGRLAAREAENRDLARRLLTVQDDERKAIALDLHDELGPYLFGLRAATSDLQKADGGASSRAGAAAVATLSDLTQAIQVRTRRIISALRPMSLGEVALGDLVEDLIEVLARLSDRVRIDFDFAAGPHSYGEAADLTVYRFVQESVVNALRHGRARTVTVRIVDAGSHLTVAVLDDGAGPLAPPGKRGYGMIGIAERVRVLGGRFAPPARRDGRTVTEIRLPVEQRLDFTTKVQDPSP